MALGVDEDEDEPDEDEPPDDELPDDELPDDELPDLASADDLLSLEVLFDSELSDLAVDVLALLLLSSDDLPDPDPGLPYRSAYQPPPFNRNPVPPETRRFAFFAPHDTQVSSARSLIDCSASHWWPQASHTYS
ncbi:MAG TPA: hypothetical protein VMG12_27500 [Polyangiaceae bacterium]|nr:hypothetical protein [Polyangiaceae bacterium]